MPDFTEKRQPSLDELVNGNAAAQGQTVLEGLVEDIIYRNDSNGYTVVSLAGGHDRVAVGTLTYLSEGESVRLFGKWAKHPDYGRQFQVERYELVSPQTQEAILNYLGSGLIKGIGPKTAQRLVREFGKETLDILRDQPEKTAGVKGIGSARAASIAEQLREKKDYQDLLLLLNPLGIGPGKIMRIYRQYGADALRLVSENPYRLADEVYGIGFLTADRLARDLGLDPASNSRVAGALRYCLSQSVYNGHTYLPLSRLLSGASSLLELTIDAEHPAIGMLSDDRQICRIEGLPGQDGEPKVSPGSLCSIERSAALRLLTLLRTDPERFRHLMIPAGADKAIRDACRRQDMELAPEQKDALMEALRSQVLLLTGGPGTGKTTIIRLLCDCFAQLDGKVMLAAPTGRAARRMAEATGHEAKTLHRLLEIQFNPDGPRHEMARRAETSVKLDCDLLIVDEASMIDVFLFKALVDSVKPGTRLVLVGDADQLPSVGPGYVLKDLIDSGQMPVVRLTRIYRQSSQSLIIRNAHLIHDGQWPEIDQRFDSHFLFVVKDKPEEIAAAAIRLCTRILPEQYGFDPLRDIQVLTPSHKGPAGTASLNGQLQDELRKLRGESGDKTHITAHGCRFFPGDKVMQNRNNYEIAWRVDGNPPSSGSGVFNGEMGTVVRVDPDEDFLEAVFDDDRLIVYDRPGLEDLELAYAITIHKSQGSEYPVVVLAIPPGAPQLLTRNLLYTAVTRARSKLLLVTSRRVLAGMLANSQAISRFTLLRDWMAFERIDE